MRGNRRGGHKGLEFGGSGEDSFVAVVVTKLTGALLFILLLTMVIMALIPKANETLSKSKTTPEAAKLEIKTPEMLPEALAGRPYVIALAATGGSGELEWSVNGKLPEGIRFDPETGRIEGTAKEGTAKPVPLTLRVTDGEQHASQATQLLVYQSDKPLATPAWWKPGIPPIPWRAWLEQGFGFLILILIHTVGINTVGALQRWSLEGLAEDPNPDPDERPSLLRRFAIYRWVVRFASLAAVALLATWLVSNRG